MNSLEHKIPPPILVVIVGAAMWAVALVGPTLPFERDWRLTIAVAFVLSGLIVTILGVRAFGRAGTTINPVQLEKASSIVTDGVFRYTRNPMYVGLSAILVGWAVYLSMPWVLLGPVAFILFITRFQIIPEERVMLAKFGREYGEYRARVRRWL